MAELTTVEINEPTQGEIEPASETVEEQPQPEHIATDSQEEGAVEEFGDLLSEGSLFSEVDNSLTPETEDYLISLTVLKTLLIHIRN